MQLAMEELWTGLSYEMGVDALFRRGDSSSGSLRVIPGASTTAIAGTEMVFTNKQADFVTRRSLVNLGGDSTEPRNNDRLEIFGHQFELLAVDGERCFDPVDPSLVMIRMHTKWLGPVETTMFYMVKDVNDLFVRDANGQFAGTRVNGVTS